MKGIQGREDTIVALATPPGRGAIGVIRMSGPKAISIANRLFPSRDLDQAGSPSLQVGALYQGSEFLDEVVLSLFRSPRSYTGEDIVELSCHGSPYILDQVIQACIAQGARLAGPGEFTLRAFFNGKMDLAQAEAVADLVAADSRYAHDTALRNLKGGFSRELWTLRENLLRFGSLIELELDFSQEDIRFADRRELLDLIREAQVLVDDLVASFRIGNAFKIGVSTVIAGKPNSGKSTLLNAMLREDRALVSEWEGTTRDSIEEVWNLQGIPFRLIDTAGLRPLAGDPVEQMGIDRTRNQIRQSAVLIYLFDLHTSKPATLSEELSSFDDLDIPVLAVGNKIDCYGGQDLEQWKVEIPGVLLISALTRAGLPELEESLVRLVLGDQAQAPRTIIANIRHLEALRKISASLRDIRSGVESGLSGDLLALEIRSCLNQIGEITGEVSSEEKLDFIFSRFCIGK